MDLATAEEKTRWRIKLYGLLASLMKGTALQLVKAVEDMASVFHEPCNATSTSKASRSIR